MARVRRGRRVGLLTDAFASARFARTVLAGLARNARIRSATAKSVSVPAECCLARALPPDAEIEWPRAEQSNSTMIVGRKVVHQAAAAR